MILLIFVVLFVNCSRFRSQVKLGHYAKVTLPSPLVTYREYFYSPVFCFHNYLEAHSMVARGRLVKTLIDDNFLFTSIFSLCLFWTRLEMALLSSFLRPLWAGKARPETVSHCWRYNLFLLSEFNFIYISGSLVGCFVLLTWRPMCAFV